MAFFSSVFILVYIISMAFCWGSTDYFELSILHYFYNILSLSTSSLFYKSLGIFFSLGFLLKAGAAPFHVYKVSLFKGIPLFSVIVYTSMFYLTYISYFAYLMPTLVYTTGLASTAVSLLTLLVGTVLLLNSLFSNRHLKSFLALSSSLNALMIVMLLLVTH